MHCTFCGKQIMLKIGFVTLAVVAVVSLGACGAVQSASRSAESEEQSTIENVIGQKESEVSEDLGTSEEEEVWEESAPIDEALEQYRTIVSQADSYDYGKYAEANQSWQELIGYRYALVQMRPDDLVPALLLEREIRDTELSVSSYYARVFQYEPDTKTVSQPTEVIADGGIRGGLSIAGDGDGIMSTSWSGGTGEGSVIRIKLDRDSLNRDTCWTGQIFEMPDSITFIEIEWHDITDFSALDSYVQLETQTENENTSLLADYVGTYTSYELFHDWYGGGERLRDIILAESGMVTGGGTSWNTIDVNGLEPSEILQNVDGSIEITFNGSAAVYKVYPAGVVPDGCCTDYTADYWQGELDLSKVHIQYIYDDGVNEILYHN